MQTRPLHWPTQRQRGHDVEFGRLKTLASISWFSLVQQGGFLSTRRPASSSFHPQYTRWEPHSRPQGSLLRSR